MQIPNKSQFKLEEVSSITGVKPYVLRFWESEFSQIDPTVVSGGKKVYSHNDIRAIASIKTFLFDKKMTIEEAKKELFLEVNSEQVQNDSQEIILNDEKHFKKELSRSEVQKLILAKAKLSSLVLMIGDFKKNRGWS